MKREMHTCHASMKAMKSIDMFGLPEDKEYIEEIDTGDEPL
jgi:hypothetical protein